MTTSALRRGLALPAALALLVVACGDDDEAATVSLDAPADGASIAGGVALAMSAEA